MRTVALLVVCALTLLSARTALADKDDFHLRAEAASDFPLDVAGRVTLEGPLRLRLSTSLGVLPSQYVDGLNGVLVNAHAYSDGIGQLVGDTFRSSLVFRTHVGIRPFAKSGFYIDAGYGLVSLGGDANAGRAISDATKWKVPAGSHVNVADLNFSLSSKIHMLDVELGWELTIARHIALRFAFGGAFTMTSTTTITPEFSYPSQASIQPYLNRASGLLDHIYQNYGFVPVLTVGAGYAFF